MKLFKWLVLLIILAVGFFYWEFHTVAFDGDEPIFFEIAPGEHFADIAPSLKEQGLIHHEFPLKLYARLTGIDTKIKAGRFRIDPGLSPVQILEILTNPEYGQISVTIPEGFSIFDIDERLTSLDLIKKGDFLNWAKSSSYSEGRFFPDTYSVFSKNFQPQDLGNAMLKNFDKKMAELAPDFSKSKHSLSEIIAMASILEKEVREKEDLPVVSGILWKRLDNKWPMQADATILYGKKNRTISPADLEDDGPYNTYTRPGLPPTPISNPGLPAIRASLNPTDSPYWFYLTDGTGKAIYAKTDKEHEQNKQRTH